MQERSDIPASPVVHRMHALVREWDQSGDHRSVFLRCYMMMTVNTIEAIERQEFRDPPWVERLLHRFAEYYFEALEAYQRQDVGTPQVWQLTLDTARLDGDWVLQHLLLGVNAHINYDLALTLEEILRGEWPVLDDAKRAERYEDYCLVNSVIGRTIDAVQDDILAPGMPLIGVFDVLLGRMDEFLISRFITHWRDAVWKQAVALLETQSVSERDEQILLLEKQVLQKAEAITKRNWRQML